MLRLGARLNAPYQVAIAVPRSDTTIAATVTPPDGPATALTLTTNGDVRTAPVIPAIAGRHLLTITASDDATLVGVEAELHVAAGELGHLAPIDDIDPVDGPTQRLLWPCPTLSAMPGISSWSADAVRRWLSIANQTLFEDSGHRFPGTHRYTRLRPRVTGRCLCLTPSGRWGFDLFESLRYPALELLEVEVAGTPAPAADWSIERRRWLIPADGVEWPEQDWDAAVGQPGTWSVLVRYGRPPPRLVVMARDQWALSMLCEMEPMTTGGLACRLPEGTRQLVENGRTIDLDPEQAGLISSTLATQVGQRWGTRRRNTTTLHDVADPAAPAIGFARVVPGDQTPASHAVWLNSRCDLDAELAALAGP